MPFQMELKHKFSDLVVSRKVIPEVLLHSVEYATIGMEMHLNLDASTTEHAESGQWLMYG